MSRLIKLAYYLGSLVFLLGEIISSFFSRQKKNLLDIINQMIFLGFDSLGLVSVVALFTGIIIAFQSAYQLQRLSSEIYIASLVALSLTRELGPVLASLIVAGRSGAAITAQISSMKATEQLDALKTLGAEPVEYLIMPRFIALVVTLPLLIVYADFLGILGGYIVGGSKFGMSFGLYFRMSLEALQFKDILAGLIKSFVFAIIIGLISAREAFDASGASEGVGIAVNKEIVRSFIMIIIADCFLTTLFYSILR